MAATVYGAGMWVGGFLFGFGLRGLIGWYFVI